MGISHSPSVKHLSYLIMISLTNSFWLLSCKQFLIFITWMRFELIQQMVYKVQVSDELANEIEDSHWVENCDQGYLCWSIKRTVLWIFPQFKYFFRHQIYTEYYHNSNSQHWMSTQCLLCFHYFTHYSFDYSRNPMTLILLLSPICKQEK